MSKRAPSFARAASRARTGSPASACACSAADVRARPRAGWRATRSRAEHFLARVAAHRLVGGIDVDDAEIGVAQHQRVGEALKMARYCSSLARSASSALLALGDLARRSYRTCGLPRCRTSSASLVSMSKRQPSWSARVPLEAQRPAGRRAPRRMSSQHVLVGIGGLVVLTSPADARSSRRAAVRRLAGLGLASSDSELPRRAAPDEIASSAPRRSRGSSPPRRRAPPRARGARARPRRARRRS